MRMKITPCLYQHRSEEPVGSSSAPINPENDFLLVCNSLRISAEHHLLLARVQERLFAQFQRQRQHLFRRIILFIRSEKVRPCQIRSALSFPGIRFLGGNPEITRPRKLTKLIITFGLWSDKAGDTIKQRLSCPFSV